MTRYTAEQDTVDEQDAKLWHDSFNHLGYGALIQAAQHMTLDGYGDLVAAEKSSFCSPCILGKTSRAPFPASTSEGEASC
eukprot:71246-Chlamydomonas_euryale.AAC.1